MEARLCSFRDEGMAGMVEDLLRQQGLHPRPLATAGRVSLGGVAQWYDLWVPEEEEQSAREFLAATGHQDALVRK